LWDSSAANSRFTVFALTMDLLLATVLTLLATQPSSSGLLSARSRIAFQSIVDGDNEILVINADASGITCLTNNDP